MDEDMEKSSNSIADLSLFAKSKTLPPLPEHLKKELKPLHPESRFVSRITLNNRQIRERLQNRGNASIFNGTRPSVDAICLQKCDPSMISNLDNSTLKPTFTYNNDCCILTRLNDDFVDACRGTTFFGVPAKESTVDKISFNTENFIVTWDNGLSYGYCYDDLIPLMQRSKTSESLHLFFNKTDLHFLDFENVHGLWKSFIIFTRKLKLSGVIPFNVLMYILSSTTANDLSLISYHIFGNFGCLYHFIHLLPHLNVFRFDARSSTNTNMYHNLRLIGEYFKGENCLQTLSLMVCDFVKDENIDAFFQQYLYPTLKKGANVTIIVDHFLDDNLLATMERLRMRRTHDSLYGAPGKADAAIRYVTFYGMMEQHYVIFSFFHH